MILFFGWIIVIVLSILSILPLGMLFCWGVFSFLFSFVIMIQPKTKLTHFGIGYLVIGLMVAIITGLEIFLNYDVMSILLK